MSNITDIELINRFISWCIDRDFNQSDMARVLKRTKQWASLLVHGKINRLQFDTRNRIKSILGIQ